MRTTVGSKVALLFMTFVLLLAVPAVAFAQEADDASGGASSSAPTIQSDKEDYPPGATVVLTGSGWQPGESVNILVDDDQGKTWSRSVDVTADANGDIRDEFQLPDWFVATYSVKAVGSSGTATASFTDGTLLFELATAGNAAPSNLTWSVAWDLWQGSGQSPNNTCAGTRSSFGTATYSGNVLTAGSQPGINDNASAKPTGAQATGGFASQYVFDYWSSSPTSTTPLASADLCKAGSNGSTVVKLYAHFKLADSTAPTTSASATKATDPVSGYAFGDWSNKNVSVTLNAADNNGGSGVKETRYTLDGSDPTTSNGQVYGSAFAVSAEGTTTVKFRSWDNAGNAETVQSRTIKIDKTAPSISPADVNDTTWRNTDRSASFTASDNTGGSGLATNQGLDANNGFTLTASAQSTKDTGGNAVPTSVSKTITDQAGNSATRSLSALIDKTRPVVARDGVKGGTLGNNDWYTSDILFGFTATDNLSGLAEADQSFTRTTSGEGSAVKVASGTVTDQAGNVSESVDSPDFQIDKTAPSITVGDPTSEPNSAGWYNAKVTNNFSAEDALSGLAGDADFQKSSGDDEQGSEVEISSGPVSDKAGNVADAKNAGPFKIDMTAPVISDGQATTSPNSNNWYNEDVTNKFTASDALSGLAGDADAEILRVTQGQGEAVTVASGPVADKAGNVAPSIDSAAFKIDKTAPTLNDEGPDDQVSTPNENGWYNEDVANKFSATDNLSGLADADKGFSKSSSGEGSAVKVNSGTVTDKAGNESGAIDSAEFKIDKTKPVISGEDVADTTWRNTGLSESFTASDTLSGIAEADESFTLTASDESGNADEPTRVSRTVTDAAGNSAERKLSALIDKTRPVIADKGATEGPDGENGWYVSEVTNRFEASDGLSGFAGEEDPYAFTRSSGAAEGGAVEIDSGAVTDRAGNESESVKSATFKIDMTAPEVPEAPVLRDETNSGAKDDNVTSFTEPEFDVIADDGDTVTLYKDNGENTAPTALGSAVAEGGKAVITSSELDDGTYTIFARTRDAAGNVSTSDRTKIKIVSVTIDSAKPVLDLPQDKVVEATGPDGARVTYNASATDSVDGNVDVDCQPASGTVFPLGLTTVDCSASDNAGNEAAGSFEVEVVDTTAPDTEITSGPSGWINEDRATFDWTGSDAVSPKAGLQYSYRLDGGDWSPYGADTSATLRDLDDGPHTFDVRARDGAGHVDPSAATQTFKVDTIAPSVQDAGPTSEPNSASWYKANVTNRFTASDDGSGLAQEADGEILKVTQGQGEAVTVASGPVADKAGNVAPSIDSAAFKIDKTAPTLNPSVTPNPVLLNGSATASAGASDALSGIKSQSCDPVNTSAAGSFTVACSATDVAGNTANANAPYEVSNISYSFDKGFYQPVDMKIWNTVKAGSTVPMKFELFKNGAEVRDVAEIKSATHRSVSCALTSGSDAVEVTTAGATTLRFDATSDQFIFNWKTGNNWSANSCYEVTVLANDATTKLTAYFKMK